MNPRPITHGHLWLVFTLPSFTSCKAGVSSRLQRAVSVAGIAPRFLQRSIRGSVSGRYPVIPLLGISVRKAVPSRHFYLFAGFLPRRVYMRQRVATRWNSSISTHVDLPFSRFAATLSQIASCMMSIVRSRWLLSISFRSKHTRRELMSTFERWLK